MMKNTEILDATKDCIAIQGIDRPDYQLNGSALESTNQVPGWLVSAKNELINNRETIALPTETVYGLAANAKDSTAVDKIFKAKNRPADNPLIVHISSLKMLKQLYTTQELEEFGLQEYGVPKKYLPLIKRFWPGPLTILVPKPASIPLNVLGNNIKNSTLAVRMPDNNITRLIIEYSGVPIAAPSANSSGKPSPTSAIHVYNDLLGKTPVIIDGGKCGFGLESTVVDGISGEDFVLLRPGGITAEQITDVLVDGKKLCVYGKGYSDKNAELHPTTPGMKYKHYSPLAQVILFVPESERYDNHKIYTKIASEINGHGKGNFGVVRILNDTNRVYDNAWFQNTVSRKLNIHNIKVCDQVDLSNVAILPDTFSSDHDQMFICNITSMKSFAINLFGLLRLMDDLKVALVFVIGVEESNEGLAIMNRLKKASCKQYPI
ncbi:Threonylcarbamoyl-AMP synthase [Zancudomyces culisetae]|uniref:Threonylcarbamoyl-AMP synthase n=1 Tax=Zancudomyces culisetae TaxID=1213189 RepID=A0A1R1PH88_ZANCU|nr:Threonylcarbamoyl-AMP synthase [Zancudomyces culisetae]|eukprot:OMH80365.1 Threonylcarbamoyl-AMP synthase [Zancudomyces culisetae]